MNIKNNKIIFLVIVLLLLSALIIASFMLFFNSDDESTKWLRGTVYIDGTPAPAGVNVSVIFANKTISDRDGTNESGMYEIEVTDYEGESFELYVIYQGSMYLGSDEIGNPISMSITEDMNDSLDIFVVTSEDDDDGGDDQSDDDTNDTGDDDTSNDEDGSSEEGDADDNETDDSDSDNDSGGDNGSDSDNDNSNDGDTEGDDEDAEPSNDEDDETESTYLFVDKSVWQDFESEWDNSESIEIDGTVQFNITVIYNGSNLSEIQIIDTLPEGLSYEGDATVNGISNEPEINQSSYTLEWNLSAVSNQNTSIYIEYNTSVEQRNTLQNNVTVNIIKNESDTMTQNDMATVYVFGELNVSKNVKNINETVWNETTTVPLNGMIRFNISIEYNGTYEVENVSIMDKLPNGITYRGNATFNGENSSPYSVDNNRTLFWNQTLLQPDEKINIEFDANISENATLKNTVQVWGNETLGKQFNIIDIARVTGKAPKLFICKKTVKGNDSWEDSINAFVGETVTFNVTITNLEMSMVTNLAVLDTFPSGLKYVNGSSVVYFDNETYGKEPSYHEETNTYMWINFNEDIEDYFKPNDTLTLQYDVIILEEGMLHNHVKVNSSLCGTCDPLFGYDSATINATTEFTVDILVPEPVYVDKQVTLSAQVAGGVPPYSYSWDLDDDGEFDDENSSLFTISWNASGEYTISVKVTDNTSEYKEDVVVVNVTVEPLSVDAGGPYSGNPGELILFDGFATGGLGNYTWFWDFGDGNVSAVQESEHAFNEPGIYYVTVNVSDERNISALDTTTVTINEPDHTAPSIEFESPINAIYIRNRAVFPFFRPLIFGSIEINVRAEDEESSVESIDIYINSKLVKSITGDSGNYTWDEPVFGRRTITVKAMNSEGIEETEENIVWKFF